MKTALSVLTVLLMGSTIPAFSAGSRDFGATRGDHGKVQLFVLLDDSSRSSSLGVQLPQLRSFVESLPPNVAVGIGYMQNGRVVPAQGLTEDHEKAAAALRLPMGTPGGNGSPYFALSDLAKHWPSSYSAAESGGRRVVLMLTDGVDRYYDTSEVNDPYVDAAIHDAKKNGVAVSSIYLSGAGLYGLGGRQRLFAQSRLNMVSEETGGHAYFQGLSDPVSIAPFLSDFRNRLEVQ